MIRVCPKRDAECPHGMRCPYVIDRYDCLPEEPPIQRSAEPTDAPLEGVTSVETREAPMSNLHLQGAVERLNHIRRALACAGQLEEITGVNVDICEGDGAMVLTAADMTEAAALLAALPVQGEWREKLAEEAFRNGYLEGFMDAQAGLEWNEGKITTRWLESATKRDVGAAPPEHTNTMDTDSQASRGQDTP